MATTSTSVVSLREPQPLQLHRRLYGGDFDEQNAKANVSADNPPQVAKVPKAELSFGVELEMIMAFHETLLLPHLPRGATVLKDVPKDQEPMLRRHPHDERYRSWAVITEDPHPATPQPNCALEIGGHYRAYCFEAIKVAQSLLGADTRVHESCFRKSQDFSTWQVQNDTSLSGYSAAKKAESFPNLNGKTDEYDTWGVEVVSPPFSLCDLDGAMASTKQLLGQLNKSKSAVQSDEQCGLHVHIGRKDNSEFDLSTLKHLAYLLIVYEDALFSLRPKTRRQAVQNTSGQARENFCSSLRERFALDEPKAATRQAKHTHNLPVPEHGWDCYMPDLHNVRSQIFGCTTAAALVKLLQGAGRHTCVNFKPIIDPRRPNIVEFRQHTGTLETATIRNWIELCQRLVELAELMAEDPTKAANMTALQDWDDVAALTVKDLADTMGLSTTTTAYWQQRVGEYGVHRSECYVDALPPLED